MYSNTETKRSIALWLVCSLVALSACVPDVVRHNEAGNKHFTSQSYEESLDEYRLAQVAEPDLAEPYYNAANSYNRMSEVEGALAQTEQALKTADPALAAQAWYNLGNAYFDSQQWPQAIEAYQEALRLRSDDADAKHNLELALQKLQQQQQQQQQQGGNNQQDQNRQDQNKQDQNGQDTQSQEQAGATPTPEGETASQSQPGQEQATPQPSGQLQEGQMTEEQAAQLLRALLDQSQTLQEYLQKTQPVDGPKPEQDW
jgi:Ca-activated chloride channel family protein